MSEFVPPNPQQAADKPSNLAIATLICGVGSWLFLPWIGSFLGLIFGFIELGNIKKGKSPAAGKTFTQIGFYLSIAQIVLTVLGGCLFVAVYLGFFAMIFGSIGLSEIMAS